MSEHKFEEILWVAADSAGDDLGYTSTPGSSAFSRASASAVSAPSTPRTDIAMMIARGALYGIVDPGPYDDSWGGPSHAGAWLVHFVVSLPVIALALMLVTGVARLRDIVARSIYGHRPPRWAASMAVITCVGAAVFFIAWLRQI